MTCDSFVGPESQRNHHFPSPSSFLPPFFSSHSTRPSGFSLSSSVSSSSSSSSSSLELSLTSPGYLVLFPSAARCLPIVHPLFTLLRLPFVPQQGKTKPCGFSLRQNGVSAISSGKMGISSQISSSSSSSMSTVIRTVKVTLVSHLTCSGWITGCVGLTQMMLARRALVSFFEGLVTLDADLRVGSLSLS